MMKAVVICPGRGTYNKAELGYLNRYFPDKILFSAFDDIRVARGQESLTALDQAERFSTTKHTRGDNASALIFAASLGDFLSIDRNAVDIVAVTGNSMGWYTALACSGAMKAQAGFELANTMGQLMQEAMIGGQLIYPFVDQDWVPDLDRKRELLTLVQTINNQVGMQLALSIDLGGMLVVAGNEEGLKAFQKAVPPVQDRFPMRLANHAAFHTLLQTPVAAQGRAHIKASLFGQPQLPLIDGRGAIWWPHACETDALWHYTLGHQVTEVYDFTHAITVAAREFAPDLFILTGPGATLGGAIAQSLILANWRGLTSKDDFQTRQANTPILASMGMDTQRSLVAR